MFLFAFITHVFLRLYDKHLNCKIFIVAKKKKVKKDKIIIAFSIYNKYYFNILPKIY